MYFFRLASSLAMFSYFFFFKQKTAYEMGDGRYPHIAFNAVLASWGVVVTLGAAARAQAAATRRGFLGEVIPGIGGGAPGPRPLGAPPPPRAGGRLRPPPAAVAAPPPLFPRPPPPPLP